MTKLIKEIKLGQVIYGNLITNGIERQHILFGFLVNDIKYEYLEMYYVEKHDKCLLCDVSSCKSSISSFMKKLDLIGITKNRADIKSKDDMTGLRRMNVTLSVDEYERMRSNEALWKLQGAYISGDSYKYHITDIIRIYEDRIHRLNEFDPNDIKSLCDMYKWRYVSSETQEINNTVSVIVNDKLYEISTRLQVHERRVACSVHPYQPTQVHTLKIKANSHEEAIKLLHDKIGDGNYDENINPRYTTLVLTKNGSVNIERFLDKKEARKYHLASVKAHHKEHHVDTYIDDNHLVATFEEYNGVTRLIYMDNGYINKCREDIMNLLCVYL